MLSIWSGVPSMVIRDGGAIITSTVSCYSRPAPIFRSPLEPTTAASFSSVIFPIGPPRPCKPTALTARRTTMHHNREGRAQFPAQHPPLLLQYKR
ncbi:hypothetical protein PZA11_005576 [Diplocarpon coronariae]